jgi:lipopolysaccharide biosynthesis protein
VRAAQAHLAEVNGLEGFCYWHYWFHGTRVLNRPFDEVLADGEPNFPFCLSWANETWSRRWHGVGTPDEVLQEQSYSEADDLAHARWLIEVFADSRYIRLDGRPVFLIYRPLELPAARRTTDAIRKESVRNGLPEPYLIGINAHNPTKDTRPLGFDANLNFEPQLSAVPGPTEPGLKIYDYTVATRSMLRQERDYPCHPCVMVSWDNTPRRGEDGIVFINSTPEAFERHLREAAEPLRNEPADQRLLFVNAWNEWAEGNYLEPDLEFGTGWLEALRRVVLQAHGGNALPTEG